MNYKGAEHLEFNIDDKLYAYQELISRFFGETDPHPGRTTLLGWDIEYVNGMALACFTDQLLIRRLNDFLPDNDTPLIIDCGANIGLGVLNYNRLFPKSKIIAFEPDPVFVPCIKNNLKRNNIHNVKLIESAVWVENGNVPWYSEGIDGSKIIINENNNNTSVSSTDLSDYLNEPVDLLKMDIEGAEYKVISHIKDKLVNVKNIIVECHFNQTNVLAFSALMEALAEAGFKVSINTFGAWRDLIRQKPISQDHWEQYLLIAGWRKPIDNASTEETFLPYGGAKMLIDQHTKGSLELIRAYILNKGYEIKKLELNAPFDQESEHVWAYKLPDVVPLGDDEKSPNKSTLVLLEEKITLGPAHSVHDEMRKNGRGRFSHWKNILYFSTSDNSDPNINGRSYMIAYAKQE